MISLPFDGGGIGAGVGFCCAKTQAVVTNRSIAASRSIEATTPENARFFNAKDADAGSIMHAIQIKTLGGRDEVRLARAARGEQGADVRLVCFSLTDADERAREQADHFV